MGLVDQIVIVDEPAALLFIGVTPDHLDRDGHQRCRPVAADDAVATLDEAGHTRLFGAERFREVWPLFGEPGRNQTIPGLLFLSQKDAEIMGDPFVIGCRQRCRQALRLPMIGRGAVRLERPSDTLPMRQRQVRPFNYVFFGPGAGVIYVDAEERPQMSFRAFATALE